MLSHMGSRHDLRGHLTSKCSCGPDGRATQRLGCDGSGRRNVAPLAVSCNDPLCRAPTRRGLGLGPGASLLAHPLSRQPDDSIAISMRLARPSRRGRHRRRTAGSAASTLPSDPPVATKRCCRDDYHIRSLADLGITPKFSCGGSCRGGRRSWFRGTPPAGWHTMMLGAPSAATPR